MTMATKKVYRWRRVAPKLPGLYWHRVKVDGAWVETLCRLERDGSQPAKSGTSRQSNGAASGELLVVVAGSGADAPAPGRPVGEWQGDWMGPFDRESDCERTVAARRHNAAKKQKGDVPPWRNVLGYRERLNEKQLPFWRRFGVTQSAGSRYESSNRPMPAPLEMLIAAFDMGLLDEHAMGRIREAVNGTPKPRRKRKPVESSERSAMASAS